MLNCGDSISVTRPAPLVEGGATPTSPLHFVVQKCERNTIRDFIETHHYSESINGCISDYCFALYDASDNMVGAAFFGRMAMANQWRRFADREEEVTELRRLCCVDDTPKNTESYFIGYMLRWLKRNTSLKIVVSYADEEYGHVGTIYRASNFKYLGKTKGAKIIMWNKKKFHDKAIRTKYKGSLKPFAVRLKAALESGAARYVQTAGKHAYVYKLRG